MISEKRWVPTGDAAERLAIDALTFLAGEPEAFGRFLALTGMEPESLRSAAADPEFLRGVLDYLVGDEPLLLLYAAHAGIPADRVVMAQAALARGEPERRR